MPRLLAPHSAHPGTDDPAVQAAAAQLARGALLGLHGERRMWAIKKMDELDALAVTVGRLMEAA